MFFNEINHEKPFKYFPVIIDGKRCKSSTFIMYPNPKGIKRVEHMSSPIVGGERSHV